LFIIFALTTATTTNVKQLKCLRQLTKARLKNLKLAGPPKSFGGPKSRRMVKDKWPDGRKVKEKLLFLCKIAFLICNEICQT